MKYKMKGSPMQRNFPSAFKKKPSEQELFDAANDPKHPMSKANQGPDAYYAWKQGLTIAPKKKESDLYHGKGGKVMNPDGTVNIEATKKNVEHLT